MIAILLALSVGAQDKVDVRPAADVPIIAVGLVGFIVPELLKEQIAPASCRICDGSLNGADAFFHDHLTSWVVDRKTADTISNVWVYALLPASTLVGAYTLTGPYGSEGAGLRAVEIVTEAVAVQAAILQAVKFTAARQRPFARYGHADATGTYDLNDRDSHISLPSGHTGFATSLGVSLAMTATLEESRAAPWLWAAAGVASVSSAMLRMMAEKHYFTDVLTGAAIGAACGVAFPLLHKRGNALSIAAQGPSLAVSGTF
ncbi:MAG: phosphatase PAP2 family protein [Myxococcales bacterium]|nr:phosphatase PAP2 family protein [Myxococcales bacterium]